ncbi:hypothetical protein SD80_012385 [Scytonema tolypothrichoides VB-61278]|nr:hypothetical protein SD80_012385 [Scytonema tolypothrichoides VB-61278]
MKTITINVSFETGGTLYFTKKDAQKLLGIHHHHTFNAHLKVLGLFQKPLSWAEIKEILALKLFLYARFGYHTRAMYQSLQQRGKLSIIFRYYNINVDAEFMRIKNDYERQRKTQERTISISQRPGSVVLG